MKIIAPAIQKMPWQEPKEKPVDAPVWRYGENPIIGRNPVNGVGRIFNSAVVPYEDGFIGCSGGSRSTASLIFTWEGAKTGSIGLLTRIKSGS